MTAWMFYNEQNLGQFQIWMVFNCVSVLDKDVYRLRFTNIWKLNGQYSCFIICNSKHVNIMKQYELYVATFSVTKICHGKPFFDNMGFETSQGY